MATHPSVLAWRILGMEEPGGLLSMGSHRVGHDWSDLAAAAATLDIIAYQIGKDVRVTNSKYWLWYGAIQSFIYY